jgi:uncharacterized protein (UPF0332 family)
MAIKLIDYKKVLHKKKASTNFSLATGELLAATELVNRKLYKEAIVHLYFCSFYLAQSTLADVLKSDAHKIVDSEFNRKYGRGKAAIPKLYVKLHTILHKERTLYSYRTTHTPKSSDVTFYLKQLQSFHKCVDRVLVKVTTFDILRSLYETNSSLIKDFSYDIYCPKTYSHHNRITYWQPPFYINIFDYNKMATILKEALSKLRVNKHEDYVLGLNSKTSQYQDNHYLMLDFDSFDTDVEIVLKNIGGVLLKSGRGIHFIGNKIIEGRQYWITELMKIARHKELKGKVDRQHIEISIQRGYSTLRITESKIKPSIPIFYKELS